MDLTENQTKYLMLMTEQAARLRNVAERIQKTLAAETIAALEPDAEVWPGIPSSDELALLQESHAKLDLLISQRGMFFPANYDATAADMRARRQLFNEALAGTWKA